MILIVAALVGFILGFLAGLAYRSFTGRGTPA